jgi:hypothetical protein
VRVIIKTLIDSEIEKMHKEMIEDVIRELNYVNHVCIEHGVIVKNSKCHEMIVRSSEKLRDILTTNKYNQISTSEIDVPSMKCEVDCPKSADFPRFIRDLAFKMDLNIEVKIKEFGFIFKKQRVEFEVFSTRNESIFNFKQKLVESMDEYNLKVHKCLKT